MSNSSFDQKEQIRNAVDIVQYISRSIPLQQQGRMFVGKCPWHADTHPSLQVNPDRQTFKCWVCDKGGDVFSFVMESLNVDFREAMEILADFAGITLRKDPYWRKPALPGRASSTSTAIDSHGASEASGVRKFSDLCEPVQLTRTVVHRALDWLSLAYHEFFMEDPEAEPARLYISQRGISDAMVSQFRIGYAPRNTGRLMNLIKADRNRVAILEAGGVLVHKDNEESRFDEQTQTLSESEQREYYDRFYGRVIFPIRNLQGNTVSFGGRRLSDEPSRTTGKPPAKYVNGEGTIAFSKRKTIFGLDFAVNEIRARKRAEKTDRVVITEGYTDVIMAHQCGFRETVAIMGTALGLDHIRELKRHTNRMILVLDGDKPGRAKAQAALPLFVSQGVDLRILTLPDNADPCEYLLNHGAEAFEDQLEICSLDAMEHALREAIGNLDVDRDVIGSSRALDSLLAIIAKAPTGTAVIGDPVHLRMEKMIQRIATRFHVEEKRVRFELGEHRRRLKEQPDVMLRYSESEDVSEPVPETNDRQLYVYPIASSEDETEESLQTKYAKFPNSVWSNRHLLPASPETDYLELWLTRPELLEELARRINSSQLCSPVSRQLDLLGRDMMSHGILPEFQKIMLRYDDERMKKYLVFLDESAAMKNLPERLGDEHERDGLVEQIVAAFERKQIATARTRLVSDLRESTFSSEEKLQQLRELELLLRRRQEALSGGTDVMDDDGPRG